MEQKKLTPFEALIERAKERSSTPHKAKSFLQIVDEIRNGKKESKSNTTVMHNDIIKRFKSFKKEN